MHAWGILRGVGVCPKCGVSQLGGVLTSWVCVFLIVAAEGGSAGWGQWGAGVGGCWPGCDPGGHPWLASVLAAVLFVKSNIGAAAVCAACAGAVSLRLLLVEGAAEASGHAWAEPVAAPLLAVGTSSLCCTNAFMGAVWSQQEGVRSVSCWWGPVATRGASVSALAVPVDAPPTPEAAERVCMGLFGPGATATDPASLVMGDAHLGALARGRKSLLRPAWTGTWVAPCLSALYGMPMGRTPCCVQSGSCTELMPLFYLRSI